jgi:hypothetical protein
MNESNIWSIDRIAANNLAIHLGLELGADQMERMAGHFADHRIGAGKWAVEKAQARIVERLEAATMEHGRHHGEAWMDGFMKAEQIVLTLSPREIAELDPGPPLSKGRLLRQMMRRAREENRAVS